MRGFGALLWGSNAGGRVRPGGGNLLGMARVDGVELLGSNWVRRRAIGSAMSEAASVSYPLGRVIRTTCWCVGHLDVGALVTLTLVLVVG